MTQWTIMIYMAGDNDLSDEMIRAIVEMRRKIYSKGNAEFPTGVTTKNRVNFIIEFDGEHPYVPTQRYNLTYSTKDDYPQTARPVPIAVTATTVSWPETLELRLKTFIVESMTAHPANNYAVILSGHSDAFLGRTLMLDENPSGIMTLQGITEALRQVSFPNSGKLDILAFDSCIMNTIEVLYEFKAVVHTCVGSQGSIPNFTWDYGAIAENMMMQEDRDLTKEKIMQTFRDCLKDYNKGFAFGGRSVDFSAVELSGIQTAADSLNQFAGVLTTLFYLFGNENHGTQISKRSYTVSRILDVLLAARWNCQTFMFDQAADIVDFCRRLKIECMRTIKEIRGTPSIDQLRLRISLAAIMHAADNLQANIHSEYGMYVGADYRFANGVSFYYPWSFLGYYMAFPKYSDLKFTHNNGAVALFMLWSTILTSRPDRIIDLVPKLGKEMADEIKTGFEKEFRDLIKIAIDVDLKESIFSKEVQERWVDVINNSKFSFLTIEAIVRWFDMQPELNPPHSKLNPPHSKGLDTYFEYFGRTNNIFPDLSIEDDFPPNDYVPARIPEVPDV